jgi:NhaP-type Na+/H+ or K+/H+ antiporter
MCIRFTLPVCNGRQEGIRRTRETGVIPVALAGILLGMKVPGADIIAAVTFITIMLTIVIQATTTRWFAGKLGLLINPNE